MTESKKLHIGSEYKHSDHGYVVLIGVTTEGTNGGVLAEVCDGEGIPVIMDEATSYAYFHEHADASLEEASWKEPLSEFVASIAER